MQNFDFEITVCPVLERKSSYGKLMLGFDFCTQHQLFSGVLEYILSANLQTKGGQIRLKTKWQLNVVSKETKSLLMFDDPISKIPPKLTQIISSDMKSDLNCAGLPVRWPRP